MVEDVSYPADDAQTAMLSGKAEANSACDGNYEWDYHCSWFGS